MNTKRPKWHYVYFALAAFDVMTVCLGLFLNYQLMGIYKSSVLMSQRWAERQATYAELNQVVMAVNAPANDVFDTHDIDGESTKLRASLVTFHESMNAAMRDLELTASREEAAPILGSLNEIEKTMDEMAGDANRTFAHLRLNETVQAGERMAATDRSYAKMTTLLGKVNARVREIQQKHFNVQMDEADRLKTYERALAVLIILMVVGVVGYGRKLSSQLGIYVSEREAYVQQLEAAQLGLVRRDELEEINRQLAKEVEERTAAEATLQEQLEVVRRQKVTITALSTPIIQAWDGVLVLPVVGLLDSERASRMMDSLLEEIRSSGSRYAIIDLTGVDAMDTGCAHHILNIVRASALLGTTCILSGISAPVAQTIVTLGLDLATRTETTLRNALGVCIVGMRSTGRRSRP